MPTPHVVPKIILADPAANRWADQLLAVLNPILRNVAGDLRGPVSAPTVAAWLGRPLAEGMSAPSVGQVPKWNGTAWEPGPAGTSGAVTSVGGSFPITSTGGTTPTIAISGTPAGGVAYATGTTLAYSAAGAAGLPLLSGGAGAPSFGALALGTAGTVSGLLPITFGGTNSSATPTAGAVAYGTGTALAWSGIGSAGQILVSAGAGVPTWQTLATGVSSVTATAPITSSGGATPDIGITGSPAGALAYATGTTLGWTAAGTTGQVMTSAGAGVPVWSTPTASSTGAGIGGYRATTTTPDTIALSDYVVDVTTTGAFTVNLPTAGSGAGQAPSGRVFVIKNSGGATVTVTPAGVQTIDGAASFTIVTQYAAFTFISTGAGWALL